MKKKKKKTMQKTTHQQYLKINVIIDEDIVIKAINLRNDWVIPQRPHTERWTSETLS